MDQHSNVSLAGITATVRVLPHRSVNRRDGRSRGCPPSVEGHPLWRRESVVVTGRRQKAVRRQAQVLTATRCRQQGWSRRCLRWDIIDYGAAADIADPESPRLSRSASIPSTSSRSGCRANLWTALLALPGLSTASGRHSPMKASRDCIVCVAAIPLDGMQ